MPVARNLFARTRAATPVAPSLLVHAHPPSQTPLVAPVKAPRARSLLAHAPIASTLLTSHARPSRTHHLYVRAPPLPSHGHSSCTRTHARPKHAPSRTSPAPFRRPA
ncbi:hypothetical protein K438DRAFT_1888385 [Mycena galopus ATCC 62051]|nr:hypothetical protein K438DRAFT_1888385 [Mycena galopus ATCC 62051]